MHPEQLIAIWQAWDVHPGDQHRAGSLADAINGYADAANANHFRRHVCAQRRAGLSLSAAIYTWTAP